MTTDITELAQRARINAECGEHLSPAETMGLVKALEKAQQRIIALQQRHEVDPRTHEIIDMKERIAELESRTVTINTPAARDEDYDWDGQTPSEAFNTCRMICALMFRQSLRTAGIKVEDE